MGIIKGQITNTTLQSLKAKDKDWFIRDTLQKGFQIKIPPSGRAVYQVEARLGGTGKVKKFKLGNVCDMSVFEARGKAAEALNKIRDGIDPLQEKRAQLHEGMTLQQLLDNYITSHDLKEGTITQYRYLINTCCKSWLDRRVKDITKHEILNWYTQSKHGPVQIDNAYRVLNALMRAAVALEIIENSPCYLLANSRIRHKVPKRDRHIEVNHDLPKFLKAFTEYNYRRDSQKVGRDVMLLILTTGLRAKEAKSLKWENIDWERKHFTIKDTKNRRDHVVPLTRLTYSMFRYRQENSEGSEYVFRIKGGNLKSPYITSFQKTLKGICEDADVGVVSAHDLRRNFATVLNSIDIGYADVKKLLNHKEQDITAGIYIQPDIEKLRRTLSRVVDFYDLKIPAIPRGQGHSQYARGTLRKTIYGKGELIPEPLDNPTDEDPEWIAHTENEFWER